MSRVGQRELDQALVKLCQENVHDPLRHVLAMFPWGEGALKNWDGPDWWHLEIFEVIRQYLNSDANDPLCIAVASGHGAAKTAFCAWIIHWFMSCRPNPQVVCTANTEAQLTGKTWRELAKWHDMAVNRHWFEWTATSYYLKENPKTHKAMAVPWSETNTQAFAGTHEEWVLEVFDEGSDIADKIYEVTDGVFTTKKNIWLVCGNGTRNVGRFYDIFHEARYKKYWHTWNIDSRTCKAVNRSYVDRLIEQYGGEDTDQARVRVRGLFPVRSTRQLIAQASIEKAMTFEAEGWDMLPKVVGVDVARFGDNNSAIAIRQGRKVFPIEYLPKMDLMATAHHVAERIRQERPIQVFIDGSGIGAGVVDRLRQLNFSVVDVNGGNSSLNPRFLNKRAEMWWEMKEYIEGACELPRDDRLKRELAVIEYDFTQKGRILLDRKEDIMAEHGWSPDGADALAMTFAYPIADFSDRGMELEPKVYDY